MEYIVLGIILFIVGVAGTYLYDHVKAGRAKRAAFLTANPPRSTSKPTSASSSKKNPLSAPTYQYDQMIAGLKDRARRGETHVRVQPTGQREQTMTMDELIRRLELMKKSL